MFNLSGVSIAQLPPDQVNEIAKMAMFGPGGISVWQLLIILVIVVLVFGTKKLRGTGADLGAAIKSFRKSVKEDPAESQDPEESQEEKSGEEPSEADSAEKKE